MSQLTTYQDCDEVVVVSPESSQLQRASLSDLRRELARRQVPAFVRVALYPKQAAIIDDPARFTITEATTKCGKTMSHIEWLLQEAARANEGHWWWVAPVSDQADIGFRRVRDRLHGQIDSRGTLKRVGDPIDFEPNLTRKFVRLGGATIWFKSADSPDSLYGEDVRGAVADEISRWKEDAWHALYTTLSATHGRAKLIGNVKGRRNFAYRLARKAESGEPGWSYHKLTALDAIEGGVLEREVLEQAERDLPDSVYKELYFAEPAEDSGNPFGLSAIRSCISPLSTQEPVAWGWDLAKSVDWTVGIALDRQGVVCRFERFQKPWNQTEELIRNATGKVRALVDSTGVGDPVLEQLQKGGNHNFRSFKFTLATKQQLMEGLAVAIQRQAVRFPDGVIVSELENFEYEYTSIGVRYSGAEGMHDDCVCALALAVQNLSKTPAPLAAFPIFFERESPWKL